MNKITQRLYVLIITFILSLFLVGIATLFALLEDLVFTFDDKIARFNFMISVIAILIIIYNCVNPKGYKRSLEFFGNYVIVVIESLLLYGIVFVINIFNIIDSVDISLSNYIGYYILITTIYMFLITNIIELFFKGYLLKTIEEVEEELKKIN